MRKRPYSRSLSRDELLETLSQVLHGLQLPLADHGSEPLGAAAEPFIQIQRRVAARAGNSWPTLDDYEGFLDGIL